MKFIHLSDLHIGKRVNGFSMLEDQRYILQQILNVIDTEQPDAILLAGDIYDRPIPPAEAVSLLDDFLVKLSERKIPVLMISGNHDSPERLNFAARLMEKSDIHIAAVYDGSGKAVTLSDAYGSVDLWLLPFVKPVHVRQWFPEDVIETYTDAVACAIRHMEIDPRHRNVLITHQFVTGSERCESEELSVGGTDHVDKTVFEPFDYVALGHLHGPQMVDGERVRYCGTPLKYSFSEAKHEKSVTVVELGTKGELAVRTVPLTPKRDMIELRGTYLEVSALEYYRSLDREAYFRITLTDEEDIPNAINKLRVIYPNLMRLDYDNRRTRGGVPVLEAVDVEQRSPLELFERFYEQQNNSPLSDVQRNYLREIMEHIWEAEG